MQHRLSEMLLSSPCSVWQRKHSVLLHQGGVAANVPVPHAREHQSHAHLVNVLGYFFIVFIFLGHGYTSSQAVQGRVPCKLDAW